MSEEKNDGLVHPRCCPVCGMASNYVYCLCNAKGEENSMWYRCTCGVIFQDKFPAADGYDNKYFEDYANMKEGEKRLTHSARTYANLIEELTYGRTMLDVGYCVPKNMEYFTERGWLTWGIDVNPNVGGTGSLYRGDFLSYDFDLPAKTPELKALANGDSFKREFDLIWMNHSLEHFNDPIAVLQKAVSMLSSTGVMFIGTPDIDFINKTGVQGFPHFKMREHYTLWNVTSLKREVERLGMNVIMCRRNYCQRYSSWWDVHLICQKNYI